LSDDHASLKPPEENDDGAAFMSANNQQEQTEITKNCREFPVSVSSVTFCRKITAIAIRHDQGGAAILHRAGLGVAGESCV
jgi:hypothetical protein